MINLAKAHPELKVVDDQTGCPTWTVDLANGLVDLIKNKESYGIYHLCGSGFTTWHGFASKIFEYMNLETKVIPVATSEFPRPAQRPEFSAMNNDNRCPAWKKALKKYLEMRK